MYEFAIVMYAVGIESLPTNVGYIYIYIKISQSIYYTRQFKQDVSDEWLKVALFAWLLRHQSFVLADWSSLHSTQQCGI